MRCTACAETIPEGSTKCPHCGEDPTGVRPPAVRRDPPQEMGAPPPYLPILANFRRHIHSLAAVTIVFGVLLGVMGFGLMGLSASAGKETALPFAMVLFGFASVLCVLGGFLIAKQCWSVYVTLVLFCLWLGLQALATAGALATARGPEGTGRAAGGLCGWIIPVGGIIESVYVLVLANRLRALGVPLNAKP